MHLLYADETSLDPNKHEFFVYGGVAIPCDSAAELHNGFEATNAGRRPAYISHVCLILPKTYKNRLLIVKKSIEGQKLSEGDPPARFVVPHDVQEKYSKDLKAIRAQVQDSTGRIYLSQYPKI